LIAEQAAAAYETLRSRANSLVSSDPSAQPTSETFNAAIRGDEVVEAVSSTSTPIDSIAATIGDDTVPTFALPSSEDSSDSDTDTRAEKNLLNAKKALQKAQAALTDLDLTDNVLKAITYGSVRHQHTVSREVTDFGEKRTVKTYIEVTEIFEVPADHTVKDVAAAVEDEDSEWNSDPEDGTEDESEEGSVEMLAHTIGNLPGGAAKLGNDLKALIAALKASNN
jgi:hypothetical protein